MVVDTALQFIAVTVIWGVIIAADATFRDVEENEKEHYRGWLIPVVKVRCYNHFKCDHRALGWLCVLVK